MAASKDPSPQQWRRFARLGTSHHKQLRKRARRIESATMRHAHRFIVRRWENAREVRRHIIGWLLLAGLLIIATLLQGIWYNQSYHTEAPTDDTTYAEGMVGKLDSMNPLYASTLAERSAARLIFSSLLKYDRQNHLTGDLAAKWGFVDDGESYQVTLRDDVFWHDGQRLTADDVMTTVKLMKNPAAQSRFVAEWENVDVVKIDDRTIKFALGGKYAPFPHMLTFGIIPDHVVSDIAPERLRESQFSRQPVGSGPFMFLDRQPIDPDNNRLVLQLRSYPQYHGGQPRLSQFLIHTYGDEAMLKQGYLSGEVNAAVSLPAANIEEIIQVRPTTRLVEVGLHNGTFAFFNTESPTLKDAGLRRALQRAVDRDELMKTLGGNALPLNGPLLDSQYVPENEQPLRQPKMDTEAAAAALDKAGWKLKQDGFRYKKDKRLSLSLVAPRSGDYEQVLSRLMDDWRSLGVEVKSELIDPKDILRNIVQPRAYDVLVYEVELDVDPDVSAYWESSQANMTGRNLSNYTSESVDEALKTAKVSLDPKLRNEKYRTFVEEWLKDMPAVPLYQPTLHYISTDGTTSLMASEAVSDTVGRYRAVEYWAVGRSSVYTTP